MSSSDDIKCFADVGNPGRTTGKFWWRATDLGFIFSLAINFLKCHYILKSICRMSFLSPYRGYVKYMQKRDNLYIDLDGVLVAIDADYPTLKPDAMEFLEWAVKKGYRCTYLTCWSENEIYKHFPNLPRFKYGEWVDKKTEAIDFSKSFYWLEDGCTTDELLTLKLKHKMDSYIYIKPEEPYALTKLMKEAKV